ncbi:MAG2-interacting protein 2-like [Gossypium australe]|uniref:MAG2-interacting protein 2-like n=1 Tax=Gossypium australe TaxID=47621 RepID=A0A5B6UDE1_9ROSI|nr:MAG2-interacting protein 2-like [Gossypium australe]
MRNGRTCFMQDFARKYPNCLMSCLKVLMRLVMEDSVSPSQGWSTIINCVNHGLIEPSYFSICGFGAISEVLVALKSSQLIAVISPRIENSPGDLLNVETAVSCFLKLYTHFDVLVAILEDWEGPFVIKKEEVASAALPDAENDWSTDDWDEGFSSTLRISKSGGVFLDEGNARSSTDIVLGVDCRMASKMMLLLPYGELWLESLNALENKLKQQGMPDMIGGDHEFIMLVLSFGVLSTVINKSFLGTVFLQFLSPVPGSPVSGLGKKGTHEPGHNEVDILFPFARSLSKPISRF